MSNTKKFNLTINNLIDDILLVFPDYQHLKSFKEKYNLLIKYNPKKPLGYFKDTVYNYKDKIINKEEDYFIKKEYNTDLENIGDNEWYLDQVLNIKELWVKLSDENKETIWTYFNILIKLTDLEFNS